MFLYKVDDKIELRLIDLDCAEEQFRIIDSNRTYFRKWLPWVDATKSVNNTIESIKAAKKQYADNNGFQTCIYYDKQLVGRIGFHGINYPNKSTSIGYWLDEKYQGKGIMTKACKALVNYAFSNLGIHRIEIQCAENNFKSRAVPERLGFVQEGLLRDVEWLYDHYVSHIVYSMLKDDWMCQNI